MDRSDDLTRSRKFNALELGNGRTRPSIVTSRDERVAPRGLPTSNRPPKPSLEFRARQRLRTYAEASTVMDRKAPSSRLTFEERFPPSSSRPASTAGPMVTDVTPEPPSPMAESYVGRSPALTQREATHHNLEPSTELTSSEPLPFDRFEAEAEEQPIISARRDDVAEEVTFDPAPSVVEPSFENHAPAAQAPEMMLKAETAGPGEGAEIDPVPMQTPRPKPVDRVAQFSSVASTTLAKASKGVGDISQKSLSGAKSFVAQTGPVWQNLNKRVGDMVSRRPSTQTAAPSGQGVIGRVSFLPANSLLTPQKGSLAASARADASNPRPEANVRPVKNDGVMSQEPEPKRALQVRRLQDNVERTVTRTAAPAGPISARRRGRMAPTSLLLMVAGLLFIAGGAWATWNIINRSNAPVTTINTPERLRIESILDALFIDPGIVDGTIDGATNAAIQQYKVEYGYPGEAVVSPELLRHLEAEAEAMGVLDLVQ